MDTPAHDLAVPKPLQRGATDEYVEPGYSPEQTEAVARTVVRGQDDADRVGQSLHTYWSGRLGTASGLLALNEAYGHDFYQVPEEARFDAEAAEAAFAGTTPVIDIQTHYMADRPSLRTEARVLLDAMRSIAPDWWREMDDLSFYGFSDYIERIFLGSETAVAVLTAPPPDVNGVDILTNLEMAATRALIERLGPTGRLLNHTVVHPTDPGAVESMEEWSELLDPVGWKVYTMGHRDASNPQYWDTQAAFWLDDEAGLRFLERARSLPVKNICTHKGISFMVDNGAPRDVGPAARMFPDLRFIVYHSAYEPHLSEGPYTDETADVGINRLLTSMRSSGIGPGENVYAELGTTWWCLMKRPVEAAHSLGKLLLAFGEDHVLWGTDGIWYGATQPIIDAFRAFEIPEEMSAEFGYPQLTTAVKEKILTHNAAKVYDIDLDAVRSMVAEDDLAWVREAAAQVPGRA